MSDNKKCSQESGPCKGLLDTAMNASETDGLQFRTFYRMDDPKDPGTDMLVIHRAKKRGGPVRARFCPACGEDVSAGWVVKPEDEVTWA